MGRCAEGHALLIGFSADHVAVGGRLAIAIIAPWCANLECSIFCVIANKLKTRWIGTIVRSGRGYPRHGIGGTGGDATEWYLLQHA